MTDVMTPLAYLYDKPLATGRLKVNPEDFFVSEKLNFTPAQEGEHVLIRIRKIGENTQYIANELAKACGVRSHDVGWAGLKDRHAVTEQWFSVHLAGKPFPDLSEFVADHDGVDAILEMVRHDKKLRPGDLIGNQFKIAIRQFSGDDNIEQKLIKIRNNGVPNYFGSQRFGLGGNNLIAAREWGEKKYRLRDKSKRSFFLSAARSHLFNMVLSARIEQKLCHQPMLGDLLINVGKQCADDVALNDIILVEDNEQGLLQLAQNGWQISGPLTGDNALPTSLQAHIFEQNIIQQEPHLLAAIQDNRMRHDRRALLLYPQNMNWQQNQDTLIIDFFLPAGCFATALIREIINDISDGE